MDVVKIKDSARTYTVRQLYAPLHAHQLLRVVLQKEDAFEFVRNMGYDFAVRMSPLEQKDAWISNHTKMTEFMQKDTDNELVQFYLDKEHMLEYCDLIGWISHLTYYRHNRHGPLPYALTKDLLNVGSGLEDVAWYFCETFAVHSYAKADLVVSAAAFVHATVIHSRLEKSTQLESCRTMNLKECMRLYGMSKTRAKLWSPDAATNWIQVVERTFYLMLEYVDHLHNTYTYTCLETSRPAGHYDKVLKFKRSTKVHNARQSVVDHLIEWVVVSKNKHDTGVVRQFFNHKTRKIRPAHFGKMLLKVLLIRKVMSRNILMRIHALGLEKVHRRKKQRINEDE